MTAASRVRVTGPLAPYLAGFQGELAARGYTPLSAANQLRVMAHLSRWLAAEGLAPADLGLDRVEEFLGVRRREGYVHWFSQKGLAPLLDYLRAQEVVPWPPSRRGSTPVDELIEAYRAYLVRERGVAAKERSPLRRRGPPVPG